MSENKNSKKDMKGKKIIEPKVNRKRKFDDDGMDDEYKEMRANELKESLK